MMPPFRSVPHDRAGVVSAALLFALAGAVPILTLASGEATAGEALIPATAVFFASLVYLHIDSWVAAIAGPRRPGTILVRAGVMALLCALGSRSALPGGSVPAALFSAGLVALGIGLFRWLRFALRLRGRTAGAGGEKGADESDPTEIDLSRRVRLVADGVRERLGLDAVAVVAFDRGFAPLAVATAGESAGALPDVRDPAVAAELRAGRPYSDGLADASGATRDRIAIAVMSGDAPIGAILAATAPGKALDKVDVLSLRSIAKSFASPLAAAVAVARQRRRTNRLRVVHDVCKRLSECLSIDELLAAAPRALESALDHGRATICLRLGNGGAERLAAVAGSAGKSLGRDDEVLASPELGEALASPHALCLRSPRRAPEGFGFFEGTHSAVLAPIRAGGAALGAAVVESTDPDGFTGDEVSAAEMVSDFLAISLTNARLYANERRAVRRLQAVSESHRRIATCLEPFELIAIAARALRDGFEADRADAVLFRAGRGVGEPEAAATAGEKKDETEPSAGLVERALRESASAISDDGRSVAAPILASGARLGYLHVRGAARAAFAEDEVRSIETIADALAIAIEKARHVAELRERTSALAELRAAEALERARLSAILGRIPDAVIVLDSAGRVELVNDAAARILPASLAEGSAPLASRLPLGPLRRALEAMAAARRDGRSAPVEAEGEVASASGPRAVRASVQDLPGSGGVIALLRDVTEERELARTKERLFDNLTHDLRSPMTAILGFARLMRAAECGPVTAEQEECLDRMAEQGGRLLSLVDAQLDIVRLESGTARVEKSEVDVDKILSEVASGYAAAAQSRGIDLGREPAGEGDEALRISGDPRLVYRLFANLVGNAVKFTPEHGTVRVAARQAKGGVEVTVADSGIGISRADQERLFGRFVRVGAPRREASGHGLGLSIVKEIVEQHGGTIAVESDGEARGTLFRVWLPADAKAKPAAAAEEAGKPAPRPERLPRPRRVLVLDDGAHAGIDALRAALGERGDTLRIVSSHARLCEEARAFRPHSIVVPERASAGAAAAIRALGGDERTRDIEVVRV